MAEAQEIVEETQVIEQVAEEVVEEVIEEEGPSIEDRARTMGWKDRDEYAGPSQKWTPAEEFVKRGEKILPIQNETMRRMETKILDMESRAKDREDYFNMEVAAMKNRHQTELEKERAKAVEDGDVDRFNATQKQIDDLNTTPPSVQNVAATPPAVKQFMIDQPWYGTDGEMTRYADSESQYDVKQFPDLTLQENLDRTLNKVKARFPEKFGEQPVKQTQRRAPQVESGRRTIVKKNSKTYGSMPAKSQRACDDSVKWGWCDQDTFVQNYYDAEGAAQ